MSDYILVSALYILIPKGAAHAQLGFMRALLFFPAPEYGILSFRYSDFARKVWSAHKAIQASSGAVSTAPPRFARFARTLAYRVLNRSL
jgi:hypothetical protein